MADKIVKIALQDGTLVRHKVAGYQGKIEGTTGIKTCFTKGGALLAVSLAKEAFQYRVVVSGEPMRHIAPADDLEILEQAAETVCPRCDSRFRTKPGLLDKPAGRCECGGWICPSCWACQAADPESSKNEQCLKQRKRLVRKLASEKKARSV